MGESPGTIAVVPPGAYALGCWRWTEDRRRTRTVRGRKVRAPQDREIGNADPGQPEGKRHRKDTADGGWTHVHPHR